MPVFPTYIFIDDSTLRRIDVPNVLRSEMESGPDKTRPINSVPMYRVEMDISFCTDKLTQFRTWYRNEIGSGAYFFLMNDPFDGTKRRFRFFEYENQYSKTGNLLRAAWILEAYDEL